LNEFNLKLLFLDDNPVELSLMRKVLQRDLPEAEYHGITHAPNWIDFLSSNDFDAIVIDYRLTGRNGLEEIREIRKQNSYIPLFLITALERDEINQEADKFGATDLIMKDRNFSILISKLRNLLTQKIIDHYTKFSSEQETVFDEFASCIYLTIDSKAQAIEIVGNSERILGCQKTELANEGWQKILPIYKVKLSNLKTLIQTKIADGNRADFNPFEMELRSANGDPIWLKCSEKVTDKTLILVLQNITKTKFLEHQLIESQKLNTIGSLAAGIAHDFNNILAAIKGYASLGLKRIENHELIEKYLTNILKASESGSDLTSQILAFSKRVASKEKVLDFNRRIKEAVSILQKVLNPKIEIVFQLEHNLPKVFIDPGHAIQIVLNLCLNASDAMPNGGKLTLTTKTESSREKNIKFSVTDTGFGIKINQQEKIFDPFFTSKSGSKGTGLGLSVVKNIVDSYFGRIEFATKENEGTTFNVYLPVTHRIEEEELLEDSFARGGNEGLLIVDDEKSIRDFSSEYLSDLGYRIFTAEDGDAALNIFNANINEINLIILDLTLPKVSGLEVLEHVKKISPHTKIILTSGYMIEKDSSNIEESKIDDFIQKPYTVEKLAKVVRKNLDTK